ATISSMTSAIGRSLVAPIRTDAGVASGIEVSISKNARHGSFSPMTGKSYHIPSTILRGSCRSFRDRMQKGAFCQRASFGIVNNNSNITLRASLEARFLPAGQGFGYRGRVEPATFRL